MLRSIHSRRYDTSPADPVEEKRHLYVSLFIPLVLSALMILVHISGMVFDVSLRTFGVFPRQLSTLPGILTSPFIHGDLEHLLLNISAFFVLGFLLFNIYRKVAYKVLLITYLVGGLLLWFTGRPAWHIGASGVIYGMAYFIFFVGLFRSDIRSIALSLFVAFLYAGFVWGIFPIDPQVSWEGHLMGALTGTALAWYFRNVDRPPLVEWDEDDDMVHEDEHLPLKINYHTPSAGLKSKTRVIHFKFGRRNHPVTPNNLEGKVEGKPE